MQISCHTFTWLNGKITSDGGPTMKCSKCNSEMDYLENNMDFDGENYKCPKCGYRFRLYYDDIR